jgi:hypothetical protein
MSAGRVEEYGSPHELLAMKDGQFRSLVDELGPEAKISFFEVARNRFETVMSDSGTSVDQGGGEEAKT